PSTNSYRTCPDGINTYLYSQNECPSTSSYRTCPDGINIYLYSQNECPSPNVINPYIPPSFQQPAYFQPAYSYPAYQPSYNYGASFGFGSSYQNPSCGSSCGPTTPQMVQCWNGSYVYNYSQCPAQTQRCPNGQTIPINQICPAQMQTCWNGITVPLTQSCPAQYQTCWDGSVVPVTQSCPIKTTTTTTIIKQVEIINHSVVTNIPTKVSQTSAECNGVALISNRTQSVGWFEFGTTENLGKTTNSADIGNMSQSSFSNVISGLKASTTYYCRAVMANRDGTYRGKIVSFRTLPAAKKTVVYAAPKKSVKTKTKTEFVCSDGSIAVAKTVSIADTLNSGGKLLSIKIERSSPDLTQGTIINYRISITNDSDTAVSGVETKIVLPAELSFMDATTTGGVTVKDNVMTVPIGGINSKEVKTFILPAKVSATAEAGKAVITTVYASYNLPVTGSQIVKDEVSSYMTANIVGKALSSTAKSSSIASMIFPQNLLGWLVLFAVILIIVVLVMNIRRWIAERKMEKEETIHHHKA
ncbi:MAG: Ig-like protein, partial [Patescibacteria group bacterium]|nr:Ig-like protein [Patescibacteria group bacterium]